MEKFEFITDQSSLQEKLQELNKKVKEYENALEMREDEMTKLEAIIFKLKKELVIERDNVNKICEEKLHAETLNRNITFEMSKLQDINNKLLKETSKAQDFNSKLLEDKSKIEQTATKSVHEISIISENNTR